MRAKGKITVSLINRAKGRDPVRDLKILDRHISIATNPDQEVALVGVLLSQECNAGHAWEFWNKHDILIPLRDWWDSPIKASLLVKFPRDFQFHSASGDEMRVNMCFVRTLQKNNRKKN